jgi:hypothetical protein
MYNVDETTQKNSVVIFIWTCSVVGLNDKGNLLAESGYKCKLVLYSKKATFILIRSLFLKN